MDIFLWKLSLTLNEKLKQHSEKFLMEPQCGYHGRRSCIDAVFSLKLIPEERIHSRNIFPVL
jgi:hypothetical protein